MCRSCSLAGLRLCRANLSGHSTLTAHGLADPLGASAPTALQPDRDPGKHSFHGPYGRHYSAFATTFSSTVSADLNISVRSCLRRVFRRSMYCHRALVIPATTASRSLSERVRSFWYSYFSMVKLAMCWMFSPTISKSTEVRIGMVALAYAPSSSPPPAFPVMASIAALWES